MAWWLTPRTPDPDVGGSSPTQVAVVSLIKTYLHPKVLVIPRKRWLRANMTDKMFTGTLSIKQPYPILPFTIPYPIPPLPTTPHPTQLTPTLPYPQRIHTHAHNQASSSRAMLSCNSSYYCSSSCSLLFYYFPFNLSVLINLYRLENVIITNSCNISEALKGEMIPVPLKNLPKCSPVPINQNFL